MNFSIIIRCKNEERWIGHAIQSVIDNFDKKNNQSKINRLYSQRKNIYKLANHRVDCKNLDKESIAKKVIIFYEEY